MFIPVFLTTVLLAFVILSRGGTRDGVLILIASIVVLPIFTLFAPIVTTALFGAVTGTADAAEVDDPKPNPSVSTRAGRETARSPGGADRSPRGDAATGRCDGRGQHGERARCRDREADGEQHHAEL
jgi:hypothetical protein